MSFLWIKALHIAFMVAWFAGIFYLPRIFVYHAESDNKDVQAQFKVMERRLLFFVTPFAILTWVFGLMMMHYYGLTWIMVSSWLHIKLLFVVMLTIYHLYCFKLLADFKRGTNKKTGRYFRIFNEVPVIALFTIIILAIVKPALY
ncbi:protoporphyrinogen oxidase HemJ [Thalassotalea maritima]|uniref:protoporphyrinogen oxidase HemJ n=1 Tax=Thalassotalea maritima TaxID=3242416 RepID=UPI003529A3FB